jgi:hypothetical protein
MSRRAAVVAAVAGVAVLAGAGYYSSHTGADVHVFRPPEGCTASVDSHTVALSTVQAENASIIAAVAERRGLPARAISIAIATAFQESKLQNLSAGDRDSIGLFQQRPSQGWGTPTQIHNPYYAAGAFYDALVQVEGYQTMSITDAAQAVQRSAFPIAYAFHELDGRTVASALSGYSPAAFSCVVHASDVAKERRPAGGRARRALAVRRAVTRAFGPLPMTTGEASSDAFKGRTLSIPLPSRSADSRRRGWVLASYLVANASRLSIERVTFDSRVWHDGPLSAHAWRRLHFSSDSRSATSVEVEVA